MNYTRKKIVFLATYLGVVNRGAETFVIELVKQLRSKYDVEIYALGIPDDIKEHVIKIDILIPRWLKIHEKIYKKNKYYRFLCDRSYFTVPIILIQNIFTKEVYRRYLYNREDIDILFPVNGLRGVHYACKLRGKHRTPFVYSGHGGRTFEGKMILKMKPDMFVALNEAQRIWAKKYSKDVIKIFNGVDTSYFCNTEKKTSGEKIVLCCAAFVAFKRQKLLIDAVALLPNVKLILLGDGEMKDDLTAYGKQTLKNRFEIYTVTYSEVKRYYHRCDVFSLPSIGEAFGIVYAEAMAMNKPIVTTDDPVRREIVGNAGIFCDVENSLLYSKALEQALSADWNDIPRKRAEATFSWKIIGAQYEEVINTLIG